MGQLEGGGSGLSGTSGYRSQTLICFDSREHSLVLQHLRERHSVPIALEKSLLEQYYSAQPLPEAWVRQQDLAVCPPRLGVVLQPGSFQALADLRRSGLRANYERKRVSNFMRCEERGRRFEMAEAIDGLTGIKRTQGDDIRHRHPAARVLKRCQQYYLAVVHVQNSEGVYTYRRRTCVLVLDPL